DEEIFSREQMVQWFDGSHLAKSPAQWDAAKLAWVNAHYLKGADDERLAALAAAQLARRGVIVEPASSLTAACALYKDRCATAAELADWIESQFVDVAPREEDLAAHVVDAVKPALRALRDRFAAIDWNKATIAAAIKQT